MRKPGPEVQTIEAAISELIALEVYFQQGYERSCRLRKALQKELGQVSAPGPSEVDEAKIIEMLDKRNLRLRRRAAALTTSSEKREQ
jgi:hypothetical protein